MPTYDYKCTACSHQFEQFQSMKDKALRKCPKCGKNALERLIGTGAAVIFKGSGFYQTDYRSDAYRKSAEADKKPAEAKPAASETKASDGKSGGDAKPAAAEKPAPAKTESKPAPEPKAKRSSSKKR